MKYRKKPIVIEAFKYDGDFIGSNGKSYVPEWAMKALEEKNIYFEKGELYIKTLEGIHHASISDYIIKGVSGEIYPCKPDIFEKTYEAVNNYQIL